MMAKNNDLCTGCSACVSICPAQALVMKTDENGFYKPQLNADKCISCGRCEKLCPQRYREKKIPVRRLFMSSTTIPKRR